MKFFAGGLLIPLAAILFVIPFILVAVLLIVKLTQRSRDERSPLQTVPAAVIAKRVDVIHHHNPVAGDATGAHGYYITPSSNYIVTFRLDSGERKEFQVSEAEYALMIEGDRGRLHYQGAIYRGFERTAL